MKYRGGFTLIEVLITVSVIVILTGIGVIMYAKAQDRAQNSQTKSLVKQWEEALRVYESQKGRLPDGASQYVCLGTSFPASGVFLTNECMHGDIRNVGVDTLLMATLKASGLDLPQNNLLNTVTYADTSNNAENYRGIVYLTRNGGHGITYILKGSSEECHTGEAHLVVGGSVACRRVLDGDPYTGL